MGDGSPPLWQSSRCPSRGPSPAAAAATFARSATLERTQQRRLVESVHANQRRWFGI